MDGSGLITGLGTEASGAGALLGEPRALGEAAGASGERIRVDGKFFRCGKSKWFVKGLTYGPFAPGADGFFLPQLPCVRCDFTRISQLGGNAIRVYHEPPRCLLDEALAAGLRVMIDVPWEKHRCFLEDYRTQEEARRRVRAAADAGRHPAVFAISVANEIPKDIVRFHGQQRVERFLRELLDVARQQAPECLLTYTNYPSTEFLRPWPIDFSCFNLYLERPEELGAYLDRLQHLAGPAPLVLGEHGLDSLRHGAAQQARSLGEQVQRVFAHGLAGSFVFSYTDDWFAGGEQVRDWAFGVTDRQRHPKPAATALRGAWESVPYRTDDASLPNVSVVVCSYNGAATLEECLRSLKQLNYPHYEVILVDDGSTDQTASIAGRFPDVIYLRQENRGLSAARNVGAQRARGEVVAYTDSDCVADEDWLQYLVQEMRRQQVDVIGGPNVPPPSDCNIARCVAASPGAPSHVMFDDRLAEHVPGCNMAFRRDKLLELGGFDDQFRQAGDDVDICWRFLEAGCRIGFAASALVWHHRRSTIRAYLKQQAGYGRAEALLYFKHPHRFNASGASLWNGVIYGESSLGPAQLPPVIYHGRFGTELFPAIYRQNRVGLVALFTLLEWHVLAIFLLALAAIYPPMALVSVVMWSLTVAASTRAGWCAVLAPASAVPSWTRPLVSVLHVMQPVVRSWHRWKLRLRRSQAPLARRAGREAARRARPSSGCSFDLYWTSTLGRGRELLLERTVEAAQRLGWSGDFHCHWEPHDLLLMGDNWHAIEISTATEELGNGSRFTRARMRLRSTKLAELSVLAAGAAALIACWRGTAVSLIAVGSIFVMLMARALFSRRRCHLAACALLDAGGAAAGLVPVNVNDRPKSTEPVIVAGSSLQVIEPKATAA
jgi:GT2 family glycosyltransferase